MMIDSRAIATEMERLREMHDEGEISDRDFDRQYGALARQLLGEEEYQRLQNLRHGR